MSAESPNPDATRNPSQAYGEKRMKPRWIVAVGAYLVVLSLFTMYGLVKMWPYPTPSGETKTESQTAAPGQSPNPTPTPQRKLPDPEKIRFFAGWDGVGGFETEIYLETRLLLLVMLSGALGSLMHAIRSLYWYTGNRMMVWSWVALYLLLPITGAILAIIFYFVVRGGFFSPQASFENTSPFGFAALSALVGLFSPQATLKLKEIAETIFSKPAAGADNKPQGSTTPAAGPTKPAPTLTAVAPDSGAAKSSVVLTGTGFTQGAIVKFGGETATVSSLSDTSIQITVPVNTSANGPVDVEVTNPDTQKATLSKAFTYVGSNLDSDPSVDVLDGHEEIQPNTGDEELPITEGGVE